MSLETSEALAAVRSSAGSGQAGCHGGRLMEVAKLMNRALVGVSPTTRADEAEAVATAQGVDHLLVLDCDDLVGVTSVGALHEAGTHATVGECMCSSVPTIRVSASIDEAAEIMRQSTSSCLPVVAGGLILGTVTRAQLAVPVDGPPARRSCHSRPRKPGASSAA